MQTFEEYKKAREKSVNLLREVSKELRVLGGSARSQAVLDAAQRLECNDFRIIFCGEFKRGKSTLINAILGQKSLPMKIAPCTGVITEVKYAQTPQVIVHPQDGQSFATIQQVLGKRLIQDDPYRQPTDPRTKDLVILVQVLSDLLYSC